MINRFCSKTCVKRPLSITGKNKKMVSKTNYRLMQVKSIAEYSAILSAFIKLPFVIKVFVLCILSGRFTQVLMNSLGIVGSRVCFFFKSSNTRPLDFQINKWANYIQPLQTHFHCTCIHKLNLSAIISL